MPWMGSLFSWAPGWLFVFLSALFFLWSVAMFFLPFLVWGIFKRTGEIERELRHVSFYLGKINSLQQQGLQARKTAEGGETAQGDEAVTL